MLPPTANRAPAAEHATRTRRTTSSRLDRAAARSGGHAGRRLAQPRPEARDVSRPLPRPTSPAARRPAPPAPATAGRYAHHRERAARRALSNGIGIGATVIECRPDWAAGESRWIAVVSDGDAHRYLEVRSRVVKPSRRLLPEVIEQGIERFAAGLPASHRLCHLINACPLHLAADGTIYD